MYYSSDEIKILQNFERNNKIFMEEDSMFLLENVFIRDHKNLKLKIKKKSLGKMQGEISQKSKKKRKKIFVG